jgi:hypothetical protein
MQRHGANTSRTADSKIEIRAGAAWQFFIAKGRYSVCESLLQHANRQACGTSSNNNITNSWTNYNVKSVPLRITTFTHAMMVPLSPIAPCAIYSNLGP